MIKVEQHYAISELKEMKTLNATPQDEYFGHPYGELKEFTDKKRIWFESEINHVVVEEFDYRTDGKWKVERDYVAK